MKISFESESLSSNGRMNGDQPKGSLLSSSRITTALISSRHCTMLKMNTCRTVLLSAIGSLSSRNVVPTSWDCFKIDVTTELLLPNTNPRILRFASSVFRISSTLEFELAKRITKGIKSVSGDMQAEARSSNRGSIRLISPTTMPNNAFRLLSAGLVENVGSNLIVPSERGRGSPDHACKLSHSLISALHSNSVLLQSNRSFALFLKAMRSCTIILGACLR